MIYRACVCVFWRGGARYCSSERRLRRARSAVSGHGQWLQGEDVGIKGEKARSST